MVKTRNIGGSGNSRKWGAYFLGAKQTPGLESRYTLLDFNTVVLRPMMKTILRNVIERLQSWMAFEIVRNLNFSDDTVLERQRQVDSWGCLAMTLTCVPLFHELSDLPCLLRWI